MAEITDDMLRDLSATERGELMARLQDLTAADYRLSPRVLFARRWFLRLLAGCCVVLVPWIVILAEQLPRHYVAGHWRLTWTGFDVALLASLAWAAWTLWHRRRIAIAATMIAATLLCCDAWFDVTTSDPGADLLVSLVTAILIEVPLASCLLLVSLRVRRVTVGVGRGSIPSVPKQR